MGTSCIKVHEKKSRKLLAITVTTTLNSSSLERFRDLKQKLKSQLNVHDINSKHIKKFHFGGYLRKFILCSIFDENILNKSIALVAVF